MSNYTETSRTKEGKKNRDGKPLVECAHPVIDFDEVSECHARKQMQVPFNKPLATGKFKSCDALFRSEEGHIFFIEFKSGEWDFADIAGKCSASILVGMDIGFIENLEDLREHVSFILVQTAYGPEAVRNHARARSRGKLSRSAVLRKQFAWLFKDTHVYNVQTFHERFLKEFY